MKYMHKKILCNTRCHKYHTYKFAFARNLSPAIIIDVISGVQYRDTISHIFLYKIMQILSMFTSNIEHFESKHRFVLLQYSFIIT